jgi:hypothetical protein
VVMGGGCGCEDVQVAMQSCDGRNFFTFLPVKAVPRLA